ncbi:MAG: methyltransferase, TIGR04325 family [Candidatus Jettenia sp.]|nr:MAG: methyltransferase, TIGR04325 family [Candidatus Jettenia sp.]
MILAPIALFTYNRLWHTQQTIEALQKNELAEASELFIFSDGPKSQEDTEKVLRVRGYIEKITGFKNVTITKRHHNIGLANSIVTGITEIVNNYGRIIVLEDDMVTSPYFLKFMNEALEFYEDDEKVICIHGYMYAIRARLPETFFLRGADCWGWATWKRGWDLFEQNGSELLNEIKKRKLQKQFDINGSYPYTKMLENRVRGKNDSWAVLWRASAFLKERLTLHPGKSLIHNIGNDNSGTHCKVSNIFDTEIADRPISVQRLPFIESSFVREEIERYLKSKKASFITLIINRIKNFKWVRIAKYMKEVIKDLIPPLLLRIYQRTTINYGFFGNYSSWDEAKKVSTGYDSDLILDKIRDSMLKIKTGEAVFERDSVVFNTIQYSWPLLAGLLWIASKNDNKLSIIDFGGSLGSTYFQCKNFLSNLDDLKWSIVEQSKFVTCGKEMFEGEQLRFFYDLESCQAQVRANVILLSAVLQYVENPYSFLEKIINMDFKYILFDRTPFLEKGKDRITIQKVPPCIYTASYPAWFFSKEKFLDLFSERYKLIAEFDAHDKANIPSVFKGFIFERAE